MIILYFYLTSFKDKLAHHVRLYSVNNIHSILVQVLLLDLCKLGVMLLKTQANAISTYHYDREFGLLKARQCHWRWDVIRN